MTRLPDAPADPSGTTATQPNTPEPGWPAAAPVSDAPGPAPLPPGVAPGPPTTAGSPPQGPLAPGQIVFLSEEQYEKDLMQESHSLPIVVLGVCGGLTLLVQAGMGLAVGGVAAAIGAVFVIAVLFVISGLIGSGAAWLVSKIFTQDFGTFPVLLLRVAALTSAQLLVFAALTAAIGPLPTLLLSVPVSLCLAMWLLGMDLLQAIVFTVLLKLVDSVLLSIFMLSIASAVAA